jgi:hypothetical protein
VNKGVFNALGVGTMILPAHTSGKIEKIMLKNVLYTPDITFTLISIGKCDNAGYKTIFASQKCIIQDKAGTILLQAPKYHGLYCVDHEPAEFTTCMCLDSFKMHKQLGHIS